MVKKSVEEIVKVNYEDYKVKCTKEKKDTYFEFASKVKQRRIDALKKELAEWEAFEPKHKVVIRIKKKTTAD